MMTFTEKLQYLDEELTRLYKSQRSRLEDINAKLVEAVGNTKFCAIGSDEESPAEVAAYNAEALIRYTTRARQFALYSDAIRLNRNSGSSDEKTFLHLESHVTRELISAAGEQGSQNSDWTINAARAFKLTALSDIARLFVDVSKA